jgi:GNAT superfamily N-acetyltransferase
VVTIVPALAAHIPAVAALLDDAFGVRPDHADKVALWLEEPGRSVLLAMAEGDVVGVSVATLWTPGQASPLDRMDFDIDAWFAGRRGAVFNLMGVAPAHRRRGVGAALSRAQLRWLLGAGCEALFGISWANGGPHTSRPLFERAGFALLHRSPDFYAHESETSGQVCPHCGTPCRCEALLYGLAWGAQGPPAGLTG